MREIEFHKRKSPDGMVKCIGCGVNDVPEAKWNGLCDKCKSKRSQQPQANKTSVVVGKRMPAAVFTDDKGNRVFVDKFGKEVKDHGYNLDTDPRGVQATKGEAKGRTMVIIND